MNGYLKLIKELKKNQILLATWQARSGEFFSPRGKLGMEGICEWNGLAHGREKRKNGNRLAHEREKVDKRGGGGAKKKREEVGNWIESFSEGRGNEKLKVGRICEWETKRRLEYSSQSLIVEEKQASSFEARRKIWVPRQSCLGPPSFDLL